MGAEDRLTSHLHAGTFGTLPPLASYDFDQFAFNFDKSTHTVRISLPAGVGLQRFYKTPKLGLLLQVDDSAQSRSGYTTSRRRLQFADNRDQEDCNLVRPNQSGHKFLKRAGDSSV